MKVHFIAIALMGLVLGAQAGAVDLTAKNFDAEVLESGKSAFVKFLAPWYVPDARHARRSEKRDRAAASFPSASDVGTFALAGVSRRFFFFVRGGGKRRAAPRDIFLDPKNARRSLTRAI
jgi:hypothetical protein